MTPLITPMDDRYLGYLSDESRKKGHAQSISFPGSEYDVIEVVRKKIKEKIPITVQGSRTGLTGAAVPLQGHILNLSKMVRVIGMDTDVSGNFIVQVQPGACLSDLNQQIQDKNFDTAGWNQLSRQTLAEFRKADRFFWPPNPSEPGASIGGMVSTNAQGISVYGYGPLKNHIKAVRLVDGNGQAHTIDCEMENLFNWLVGSEGMLGVITQIDLILKPRPDEIWGIVFFFKTQASAMEFSQNVISARDNLNRPFIAGLEFMDQKTLETMYALSQTSPAKIGLPDLDADIQSAVLVEMHCNSLKTIENRAEKIMDLADQAGGDPDQTWAFCNDHDIEQFHRFRHSAVESSNMMLDRYRQTDPRILKLVLDIRFDPLTIGAQLEIIQNRLKKNGIKGSLFGPVGNHRLYLHLLLKTCDQYLTAVQMVKEDRFCQNLKNCNMEPGYGAGKIIFPLFKAGRLSDKMGTVFKIKKRYDPYWLLNPGNLGDN